MLFIHKRSKRPTIEMKINSFKTQVEQIVNKRSNRK